MKVPTAIFAATAAFAVAAPASAAVFTPGDNEFTVTPIGGTIFTAPTITGDIGRSGIDAGVNLFDSYQFTIPQTGTGSGSVSTSTSVKLNATDLDFVSILFNGTTVDIVRQDGGLLEFGGLTSVPITAGALNTLDITYTSRGNGSYGGQLTFIRAAVPEPGTWALFILGFGTVGYALRRSRKAKVQVRYAV